MSKRPAYIAYAPQSTSSLVQNNPDLNRLLYIAARLNTLQGILDAQIEPAARSQCRVASFQEGLLLLILGDAAWATRLRYRQHKLLAILQRFPEFRGLSRIQFKVSPRPFERTQPNETLRVPPDAAQSLKEVAGDIQHPQLRAALERLATRTKANTKP